MAMRYGSPIKNKGMVWRMKNKKGLALVLGLALSIGLLWGCAPQEEEPSEPSQAESLVPLENTGGKASLTLAYSDLGDSYVQVLEEVIAKYRADFPNTEIQLKPCDTPAQVQALLRDGGADLAQVADTDQAGYVGQGLLLDFAPYMKSWKGGDDLTNGARQALRSMGAGHAYLLPADCSQEILYYRADWVETYNEPLHQDDKVYLRNWNQLERTRDLLGDQGALAIGGKGKLSFYFDAMLWSRLGRGSMLDPAAAYFAQEEGETLFTQEGAEEVAEQFKATFDNAALAGCAGWTEGQAVAAFKEGEAGVLLANSSYYGELLEALPPGALGTDGFVRDRFSGSAVTAFGFWGWGISAYTQDPGTAVHFLTYLSAADNNTYLSKVTGALPIHSEALEMEPSLADGLRGPEIRMIQLSSERQYALRPTMYQQACGGFAPLYEEMLEGFLDGEQDAASLLAGLDSFWQAVQEEEGYTWQTEEEKAAA